VVLTAAVDQLVLRQRQPAPLQPFLQARLGVLGGPWQFLDAPPEQSLHNLAARGKTGIQVDRRHQRLEGVGEDGITPEPPALELARTEFQLVAQLQLAGNHRQRLAIDHLRAQP
jgi:hypothetical protein